MELLRNSKVRGADLSPHDISLTPCTGQEGAQAHEEASRHALALQAQARGARHDHPGEPSRALSVSLRCPFAMLRPPPMHPRALVSPCIISCAIEIYAMHAKLCQELYALQSSMLRLCEEGSRLAALRAPNAGSNDWCCDQLSNRSPSFCLSAYVFEPRLYGDLPNLYRRALLQTSLLLVACSPHHRGGDRLPRPS